MSYLWYNDGSGVWKYLPAQGDITIGRGPENTLQLTDPAASTRHAVLQVRPEGVWLTDAGSLNGTFWMGAQLPARQPVLIQPGQELRIGHCLLQVGDAAPVPAQPAYAAPQPLPPYAPPAPQYIPQPQIYPPALSAQKRPFPLRPALIGGGVLLLVIALVVVLSGLLNPAGNPSETGLPADFPPLVALTGQASTVVAVDGKAVTDANNVSVSVAKGSVQGADTLRLVANLPPAAFDTQLQQDGWKRQSLLYAVELDGESENVGGAQMSFPAKSAEERLALLLDGRFVVPLEDILPKDGRLTIQAFVAPGSSQPAAGEGTHYFVISPVKQSFAPGSLAAGVLGLAVQPSFRLQPALAAPQPAGKIRCFTLRTRVYTNCSDTDPVNGGPGRVMVTAVVDLQIQSGMQVVLQQFVDTTIALLDAYNNEGKWFHQVPRQSRKVYIEISDRVTDPGYNPKTGIIYLNTKDVMGISTSLANQQTLAHELFHWIEAQRYWMVLSSLSASRRWEMEMRAEVATFLINPKFQLEQLKSKGSATDTMGYNKLGWQEKLFDWDVKQQGLGGGLPSEADDERYIQAQIARMGLCPAKSTRCIYSLQDFIEDVNNGTSNWNIAGFRQSLENIAYYLLGSRSAYTEGTYDVNDPILQNGWGYGDYIYVSQGKPPEVLKGTNTRVDSQTGVVTVDRAFVASGAIYPLRVNNGTSTPTEAASAMVRNPDVPYQLAIGAGIEFYYVVGNTGGVQHSDGKKMMTFGPITSAPTVKWRNEAGQVVDKAGIPNVRIVAVNPTADDLVSLNATFSPLPPVMTAFPLKIDLKNLTDPVNIQMTVFQVPSNVTFFTAVWNYGDGTEERVKATPDGSRKVSMPVAHVFQSKSAKEVRVTFLNDLDKPLPWDAVIIPVSAAASGATLVPITVTSWVRVELSSASNELIGQGTHTTPGVPITWTSANSFTSSGSVASNYSVSGSFGSTGLSMRIKYLDQVANQAGAKDLTCPHTVTLVNIPRVSEAYYVFSTAALNNISDIGPYMSKLEMLNYKTVQCHAGSAGNAPSSNSFFRVTFCTNARCD